MSAQDINGALIAGYQTVGLGLPTAFEGVVFNPPTSGNWASVFILPAGSPPVTLGVGGQDEETGVMQIDLNTKPGFGLSWLLATMDQLRAAFVAGKTFTRNAQAVRIASVDRGPIRVVDGWQRGTVSVNWFSRITRPEI